VESNRAGGMPAIAALNIIVGGLEILAGLFQLLGAVVLMLELSRQGVFHIPMARLAFSLLVLATGIVGLIAGVGLFSRRASARTLSFVFAGLLILSAVLSCFKIPIIASIGSYDIGSLPTSGLVRLILFSAIYVVVPVLYSFLLCATLRKAA
jgi:hypothetical protein